MLVGMSTFPLDFSEPQPRFQNCRRDNNPAFASFRPTRVDTCVFFVESQVILVNFTAYLSSLTSFIKWQRLHQQRRPPRSPRLPQQVARPKRRDAPLAWRATAPTSTRYASYFNNCVDYSYFARLLGWSVLILQVLKQVHPGKLHRSVARSPPIPSAVIQVLLQKLVSPRSPWPS
jgi:hypothetical protein